MSAKYNTWPSDTFSIKSHKIGKMGNFGYSILLKKWIQSPVMYIN